MQLIFLQQKEKFLAVCFILVIMIDGGRLSMKDPHIHFADKDMVDDLNSSFLIHSCR